jgi:glycogen debranching enzyme
MAEGEEGLYHEGTRFLSQLEFSLCYQRPLLLGSTITCDNLLLTIDLTNPDCHDIAGNSLAHGSIHIFKSVFLSGRSCYERIRLSNYSGRKTAVPLSFRFASDFRDVFEVRGQCRKRRGEIRPPLWAEDKLVLSYLGLDEVLRKTVITFESEASVQKRTDGAQVIFEPGPGESLELKICYDCQSGPDEKSPGHRVFSRAHADRELEIRKFADQECRLESSNPEFNEWLTRSYSDMRMMVSNTPVGPYPYAGVPWFSTTFGRDGIISALQMLWINPELARGVLAFLARTQATEVDPERDAEPGKILHEARSGEMANLNEIPYRCYYGTVDATPLFVMLAGEYLKATGDEDFVRSIWPNVENALEWIRTYGDADGDGFVEYSRKSKNGLVSQGWKDSSDSVFHRDGSDVVPPVALCEVQGYVYQAKMAAAFIARHLGFDARGLEAEARELKRKFHEFFWCEEIGTYALALDGQKRQCRILSSNVGHCLYTGIVDEAVAEQVKAALMSEKSFCGWGIRTLTAGQARYNPMSYHNGSVWPHDTSIAAMGLSRYGFKEEASRLLEGMFECSRALDLRRLPELFCGFAKRPQQGPTLYPMSCAPQAWAAGAVFFLIQACLGLRQEAEQNHIVLESPTLPISLGRLTVKGLRLGPNASADLELVRRAKDVGLHVLKRDGHLSVVAIQ